MNISTSNKHHFGLVNVEGQLLPEDQYYFEQAIQGLMVNGERIVVIDFKKAVKLPTQCLGYLIKIWKKFEGTNGLLLIVAQNPALNKMFEWQKRFLDEDK